MTHGTLSAYNRHGCRCTACRAKKAAYDAERQKTRPRAASTVNRSLLREALMEMFPMGLTDDCPVRRLEKALAERSSSTTAGVTRSASSRAAR